MMAIETGNDEGKPVIAIAPQGQYRELQGITKAV